MRIAEGASLFIFIRLKWCGEVAYILTEKDTAERLADRVIMISNGEIVADESLDRDSGTNLEALILERMGKAENG